MKLMVARQEQELKAERRAAGETENSYSASRISSSNSTSNRSRSSNDNRNSDRSRRERPPATPLPQVSPVTRKSNVCGETTTEWKNRRRPSCKKEYRERRSQRRGRM